MENHEPIILKKLYLITSNYPNKGGDFVFVQPELRELKKYFDVTVICTSGKKDSSVLDKDINYLFYQLELSTLKKIKYVLKYPFSQYCRQDFRDIIKRHKLGKTDEVIGRIYKSVEFYACGEEFYRYFKRNISVDESRKEAVYYTFWCNEFSLPLIIHRKRYRNFHLITRLHGCDLYEERYLYGRQPFKKVLNQELEKLYFIGEKPRKYYLDHHSELNREKAEVVRLGVFPIQKKETEEKEKDFVLVSCSNVIPLKRVQLIPQALRLLEEEIRWIHFGDGSQMNELKEEVRKLLDDKKNISYELKGFVENSCIHRFYSENLIDCFITTSSTEGAPVSIMEAMAARIPVIGTAVGEIPEMIHGNGILLSENPNIEEVAGAIRAIISDSDENKNKMREKSFQLWYDNYNAQVNAPLIANKIRDLTI